ncbi:MAG: preprotein translocase subunit SecG [Burkholderiaceae bacterium]
MSIVITLVMVAQLLSALGVIVLVLLQHGKGADMGAAFGSGASGSLFGATGSANFLSRLTAGLATVFFVSTLVLSFLTSKSPSAPKSIMEQSVPAGAPAAPAGSQIPGAAPAPAPAPAGAAAPKAGDAPAAKGGPASEIPK